MPELSSRRGTAALGLLGGVLALVGNALAPRFDGDDVEIYRDLADNSRYTAASVVILFAVLLVTAAFVGITRLGYAGRAGDLWYYARLAAVAGGTLAVLGTAVDLFAYRQQAMSFADAKDPQVVPAFWATNAVDHLSAATFAAWTLLLLGIAPLLMGAGQLRDRAANPVLAALAVIGGLLCAVVGVCQLLSDDPGDFDIPFAIGSVLVTLWLLATSAVLWRPATAGEKT
jgi:hypothetical protein